MPAAKRADGANADLLGTTEDGRDVIRLAFDVAQFDIAGLTPEAPAAKWLHICPLGNVESRDGRQFRVDDASSLVSACELPLLIDWEHQSEYWMGSTEAAGWIVEFAVEPGGSGKFPSAGVWGRTEWTPKGKRDTDDRAYRYLSPVLLLEVPQPPPGEPSYATRDTFERKAIQILSVALTNTPALRMQSIDSFRERLSARFGPMGRETQPMDAAKRKALCATLGIADAATDDQILAAASKRPEGVSASAELCASLTKQLGEAQAKTAELEQRLAAQEQATFAVDVAAVLDQASKDGKIPPAARKGYEAMCATKEGFASFRDSILPHLQSIAGPAPKSAPIPSTATPTEQTETLRKRGVDEKGEQAAREYLANKRAASGRPNMED